MSEDLWFGLIGGLVGLLVGYWWGSRPKAQMHQDVVRAHLDQAAKELAHGLRELLGAQEPPDDKATREAAERMRNGIVELATRFLSP